MKRDNRIAWLMLIIFMLTVHRSTDAAPEKDPFNQAGLSQPYIIVAESAWSPTGDKIAMLIRDGGGPGYVAVHEATSLQETGRIEGLSLRHIAWNSSGSQLAILDSTLGGKITVWDVSVVPFALVMEYETPGLSISRGLTWRPHSDELTFHTRSDIYSMHTQTGVVIRNFNFAEASAIGALGWSPDGNKLFADTARVHIWDINGQLSLQLQTGFHFGLFAWSPDSSKFVVGQGESIHIMEADTGIILQTLEGNFSSRTAISWQGSVIAAGRNNAEDFGIYLWDANTGAILRRIEPDTPPHTISLSPDGSQLFYGGRNATFEVIPTDLAQTPNIP